MILDILALLLLALTLYLLLLAIRLLAQAARALTRIQQAYEDEVRRAEEAAPPPATWTPPGRN